MRKEISDKYKIEEKICMLKCLDNESKSTFSGEQIRKIIHGSNELPWSDVWECKTDNSNYRKSFIYCCALTEEEENRAIVLGIELPPGYQIVSEEMDLSNLNKYDLTKRETEILKLLLDGMSNVEIGKKLFLSKHTINIHRTNIYRKLEVNNVKQLMNLVYRGRGLNIK